MRDPRWRLRLVVQATDPDAPRGRLSLVRRYSMREPNTRAESNEQALAYFRGVWDIAWTPPRRVVVTRTARVPRARDDGVAHVEQRCTATHFRDARRCALAV